MTAQTATAYPTIQIARRDRARPILIATGPTSIAIAAGSVIEIGGNSITLDEETPIEAGQLVPGTDYVVTMNSAGHCEVAGANGNPLASGALGGFHFAPGGNAPERQGGDSVSAINPYSIWDADFRPAGDVDPRGMALVDVPGQAPVWIDIYLLAADHVAFNGTSRHGVEIADGDSLRLLDLKTAAGIYAAHGKRLMTYDEFKAAAFGVTERSANRRDPAHTGLDAPRTSRYGIMQATGNLWVWGTDGDPDDPRPSVFGGSWIDGQNAGSRDAHLVYWPGASDGGVSARGACDHLMPA